MIDSLKKTTKRGGCARGQSPSESAGACCAGPSVRSFVHPPVPRAARRIRAVVARI